MTRKRFVKLVMGAGDSRNEAERMAAIARKHGIPYKVYCPKVVAGARAGAGLRALSKAVRKTAVHATEAAEAFGALAEAMGCSMGSVVAAAFNRARE